MNPKLTAVADAAFKLKCALQEMSPTGIVGKLTIGIDAHTKNLIEIAVLAEKEKGEGFSFSLHEDMRLKSISNCGVLEIS